MMMMINQLSQYELNTSLYNNKNYYTYNNVTTITPTTTTKIQQKIKKSSMILFLDYGKLSKKHILLVVN